MVAKGSVIFGGILTFLMFVFHTRFYKMFGWQQELSNLTLANQRILYTIHIALLILFLAFSLISLIFYRELSQPVGLAAGMLFVISAFWIWRTVWQVFYFKVPPGTPSVPVMNYALIAVFALLAAAYILPLILQRVIK
ncbi:MAG: hypothetical protein ABFD08_04975 [Syntrophomonas sp.]